MNFLSHFHFDRNLDINYNLGLVFPDLYKNFINKKLLIDSNNKNNFWLGCAQHIERDRKFHNSIFFKNLSDFTSNHLDKKVNYERKWFLNHILLEIVLDRYLMDKYPNLCENFYDNLNKINLPEIINLLSTTNSFDTEVFEKKYSHFVKVHYIFSYKDNNKISYALQRIFEKVGINSKSILMNEKIIIEFIPKLLEEIDKEIKNIE